MRVELTGADPREVGADLIAVAAGDRAAALGAPARALAAADPISLVYPSSDAGPTLAVVAVEPGAEGRRTAAAHAVRAARGGAVLAWVLEDGDGLSLAAHAAALAEGAVLGGYDGRRWTSAPRPEGVQRFVICASGGAQLQAAGAEVERAARVAGWTNVARELVDAPSNLMSPVQLAERAQSIPGLRAEVIDAADAELGGLLAVGGSSPIAPRLIVLRHEGPGAPDAPRLALVGKGVTFDTGGYFLKPQASITRQKADMGGAAAVLGAMGAIAELGLPVSVIGIVAACENLLSATATRPTDVITTAAGLTVEVINPDAEGRLILADALWYARRLGATHIVDMATLTGAQQAGMGDVYGGVFSPDRQWRDAVVAAGDASGDLAWPWPLHPRYERLLESAVADLRNVGGVGFGYPIFAATFLRRFAGDGPWAHVDMLGPALLTEDRGDAFGRGATGYGVRMLVELASRLGASLE
jgi:leucyl aminopeptidase